MRTIALVPKLGNAQAAALCRLLVAELVRLGHRPLVEAAPALSDLPCVPGGELAAQAELVIVLGGDGTRSASIALRNSVPGPSTCSCPTTSSSVRGRMRSASGLFDVSRSAAASKRSMALRF